MKKLKVMNILESDFSVYGRYTDLLHPKGPSIGEAPVRFFRDMMPLGQAEVLSLSVTEMEPMELKADVMEFHSRTGECFLTLDGDTYICVAPATPDSVIRAENMEAYYVPAGTAVYLHPGVWHYAPFPVEKKTLHSLVMLPQRVYANDCIKYELSEPAEFEP